MAFNSVIRLRRDNDYNYKLIENTFIPAQGEVCFIDVAGYGLRACVGDGTTVLAQLPYADEPLVAQINDIIVRGYYLDGAFYQDNEGLIPLTAASSKLYIDIIHSKIYTYDGFSFISLDNLPVANAVTAGIVKLYDTIGENTDGTMTQKAITDELNRKIEVQVNAEEEMVLLF